MVLVLRIRLETVVLDVLTTRHSDTPPCSKQGPEGHADGHKERNDYDENQSILLTTDGVGRVQRLAAGLLRKGRLFEGIGEDATLGDRAMAPRRNPVPSAHPCIERNLMGRGYASVLMLAYGRCVVVGVGRLRGRRVVEDCVPERRCA